MSEAKKKERSLASLVIVLGVICLVVAALLGLVSNVTTEPIAANKEKTVQESLQIVMPADSYEKVDYTGGDITLDNGKLVTIVAVYKAGDAGYVVESLAPGGFNGTVDMMAGVDNDGVVTGIAVVSHGETSGLGSKAQTDAVWQDQFKGESGSVSVTKDGGNIEAITGSTITSRCICNGVNAAFAVVESLG